MFLKEAHTLLKIEIIPKPKCDNFYNLIWSSNHILPDLNSDFETVK